MSRRRASREVVELALSLLAEGASQTEVAQLVGFTQAAVSRWARRGDAGRARHEGDMEAALELVAEGASQTEVADLLGVASSQVSLWVKAHRPSLSPGKAHRSRPGLPLKRQQAIALALDGVGIVEAAEQTGQSPSAFSRWFKTHHPQLHALAQLAKKRRRIEVRLDALLVRSALEAS